MYRFLLLCLVLLNPCCMLKAQTSVWLKGYVTTTQNYCGGAAPSPELLADLATPKPLAHKVLYIKLGAQNNSKSVVLKKVISDDSGRFVVQLRVGQTYCFIEDWKAQPFVLPQNTETVVWDIHCLRQRYAQADYVIRVKKKDNSTLAINYVIPCFYAPYCGTYTGPLPP